jgi:hypothetical protein
MDQSTPVELEGSNSEQKVARRKIPGNLPYTGSAGVLQRILEKIPISEKPKIFTQDFLSTVLGASGGSARPIIPILKATGLLNQGGAPTDLYSQFQTEGDRASAALTALRNGFPEIFKRNQYAHRIDDKALIDAIVSVTGLARNDSIVRYIANTFQAFQTFAKTASEEAPQARQSIGVDQDATKADSPASQSQGNIGLVYNINVVLPETTNIDVYNAIFRSLRGNLLQ